MYHHNYYRGWLKFDTWELRMSVVRLFKNFFAFVDKLWWLRSVVLWNKSYRAWGWLFESHLSRRKMSFTSKWALLGFRRHFGKDSSSPRSTLHTKCPLRNNSFIAHAFMNEFKRRIPQVIYTRHNSLREISELVRLSGFSVVNKFTTKGELNSKNTI